MKSWREGVAINIYGLLDPRSMKLRYIGKTNNDLRVRLAQHWSMSETKRGMTKLSLKNEWLLELNNLGIKPIIYRICEVDYYRSWGNERRIIAHFDQFCDLVNYKSRYWHAKRRNQAAFYSYVPSYA